MIKRFVMQTIAIFGLVLGGFSQIIALDSVEYKALIEKEKIKFGQSVQFLVRINYATTTMKPAVSAPSFGQFRVLNEHETNKEEGEGKDRYKVYRKIWLLEPTEPGNLSIASAIVTYQDPTTNLLKNGKTDIVFLEVEQPEGSNLSHETAKSGEPVKKDETLTMKKIIFFGGAGIIVLFVAVIVLVKSNSPSSGPPPEDVAHLSLQQALLYAEKEDLDGYYNHLSQALLDYLYAKYEINAHVIPTEEIIVQLKKYNFDQDIINGLEYCFKAADQAKFGGYNPDEDELIKLHSTVEKFIEIGRKIKVKKKKVKLKKNDETD